MSSDLSVHVAHAHRVVNVPSSHGALVQSVLHAACESLQLGSDSAAQLKLVHEKDSKAIDHSLTLKQANIKPNARLALAPLKATASKLAAVSLVWKERTFAHSFPIRASLWDVMRHFETTAAEGGAAAAAAPAALQWTEWHGVPEPEINSSFELHIHVPGYMQPVLEIGPRKIASNDEFKAITLLSLGIHSDTPQPARLKLKLSHSYTAPVRTAEEQQAVMANFQRMYSAMTGGDAPAAPVAAPQPPLPLPVEEEEEEDIEVSSSDEEPAPLVLPPNRGLKLLYALPGILRPPELPEEFYEVTEEDSRAYARGIRNEARKAAQAAGLPAAPVDSSEVEHALNPAFSKRGAPLPTAAESTAVVSASAAPRASSLLDSSRLPALPSASDRRNARARRRCRAVLLRVRLQSHLYAEALFRVDETPQDLYQFLSSLLDDSVRDDYYLYITPPRQPLATHSRLTFAQLGLMPQALVHFGRHSTREQAQGTGEFHVTADTPAEREAKEHPERGLIKSELHSSIQRVAAAAAAAAPEAAAASEGEVSQRKEGER